MSNNDAYYLVIESKETGDKFRLAPEDMPIPQGFTKITRTIPIPERLKYYLKLPIYQKDLGR